MVEGGAALITSFLHDRLVDRLAVCIAPKILGRGIEAVGDLGIYDLTDSLILADTSVTPYGVDLVLDSRVEYPDGPRRAPNRPWTARSEPVPSGSPRRDRKSVV